MISAHVGTIALQTWHKPVPAWIRLAACILQRHMKPSLPADFIPESFIESAGASMASVGDWCQTAHYWGERGHHCSYFVRSAETELAHWLLDHCYVQAMSSWRRGCQMPWSEDVHPIRLKQSLLSTSKYCPHSRSGNLHTDCLCHEHLIDHCL